MSGAATLAGGERPEVRRVLLTGAAGKLARRLRLPLAHRYPHLRASDIAPLSAVAPNEETVHCDLADPAAVRRLAEGVDAIVHFAGYPREAGWDVIVPANIVATAHVFEAAREAGVRRVVYASSNHVIGFHPVEDRLGLDAATRADSRYGVSKAFMETVARFYYDKFGVESLGIRIGRCEDRPTDERMLATWLHPEDLVQLVTLGIEHPLRADVVYGVSCNARSTWSNEGQAIPYRPAHSADDYPVADGATGTRTAWRFQGGPFAEAQYEGDPMRALGGKRIED